MKTFTLQTILNSFIQVKQTRDGVRCRKYTLLDMGVLGGMKRKILLGFFLSLPFIEFAILFNPTVFNYLGIAQSIIFYIVFMSIIMVIVYGLLWKNNQKVLKTISESWNRYFPDVSLRMLLSSGHTPYSDFFSKYEKVASKNVKEEELLKNLRKLFDEMQEENKDLLEMMQKDMKS